MQTSTESNAVCFLPFIDAVTLRLNIFWTSIPWTGMHTETESQRDGIIERHSQSSHKIDRSTWQWRYLFSSEHMVRWNELFCKSIWSLQWNADLYRIECCLLSTVYWCRHVVTQYFLNIDTMDWRPWL
jgi:hypothetical protein